MILRLSKQHIKDLTTTRKNTTSSDLFAPLLISPGALFRIEARLAIMSQCHELYCSDYSAWGMQSMLSMPEDSRAAILVNMQEFLGVAEQKMKRGQFLEKTVMVPARVFAHLDATKGCREESEEYEKYMQKVGTAARQCGRHGPQVGGRKEGADRR